MAPGRLAPWARAVATLGAMLLALGGVARAYYVPGTYPQEFRVGDQLQGARSGPPGVASAS